MGSSNSIAGRFGVLALLLIGVGCTQRTAPVDIRGANPPRAVERVPQQVYRPAPPVVQRRPVTPRPFPPLRNDLPPPNTNPVVSDVGTSRSDAVRNVPLPTPRPRQEIDDNPYQTFDPRERPATRERPQIAEQPLAPPLPPRDPVTYTPPPPRASDDYATLIGDRPRPPRAESPSQEAVPQSPGAGALPGVEGKALVALLVPESDRRGYVRTLSDGLAKAASLAAADFDESRLVLRKYDTGGDPRKAAQAAKNAIADGARLIIGPLFSGSAAAVRPIAQASNVSVIAFTTDDSVLGGGMYSIGFLPQTDVNRIVSYASSKGRRNIALLVPDTPFGGVITREARSAASRNGASIVKAQPFKEDFRSLDITATDFAQYYSSAPKVDAIVMATSGKSLQGLAAYLAYRDVLPKEVKYMGLGLWDDKETFREATLRGGWFPGVDPALKTDFAYRYGQAYGGEPPSIALLGYDAVAVAASLIREGGFTSQAILTPSGFSGMSGLFRFKRDGRNERALSILEVGQGSFRVIDPAPRSFSQQVSSLIGG